MTRKLDFDFKWTRLKEIVIENHPSEVPDVIIMEKLRFTPPSWKIWKPKLIEKSNIEQMNYHDQKNNKITYQIIYQKKRHKWCVDIINITRNESS